MQIDIVSDTVCPWCFIGKRRLERAIAARPDMEFDIRWRAIASTLTKALNGRPILKPNWRWPRPKAMADKCCARLETAKHCLAFDQTQNAKHHRFTSVLPAGTAGLQNEVVELMFRAYFEQGRDIGKTEDFENCDTSG